MHTHIGSGSDPEVWLRCAKLALGIAALLPEVRRLSLGGGFKIARMSTEKASNLEEIGRRILPEFEEFARAHGRELHLEIEPGTYIVGNAGAVVSTVTDVVDTGAEGYRFLKLDTGMTEVLRPSMYGAQHPLVVVPRVPSPRGTGSYLVVGHCCESGDILTPEPGNPEGLLARELCEAAPGDLVVVEGAGAYCAGMPAKNYNSFPEAPEVLREAPGAFRLIRRRQTLAQIIENEVPYTREA
jgi:diaminopimelate decarboxylase